MSKRNYKYQLTLRALEDKEGKKRNDALTLNFENHDDIFNILTRIKDKAIFEDEQTTTEFAIGLKLFTEVLLKNKKHPLFEDLRPEMVAFMKKLKSQ